MKTNQIQRTISLLSVAKEKAVIAKFATTEIIALFTIITFLSIAKEK